MITIGFILISIWALLATAVLIATTQKANRNELQIMALKLKVDKQYYDAR
jgi:hypothetical protein